MNNELDKEAISNSMDLLYSNLKENLKKQQQVNQNFEEIVKHYNSISELIKEKT